MPRQKIANLPLRQFLRLRLGLEGSGPEQVCVYAGGGYPYPHEDLRCLEDVDLEHFVSVLDHGPMASEVSRLKVAKLVAQDFGVQAGVANVLENSRLITQAARNAGIASPLLDVCHALYAETHSLGLDGDDMVAVVRAIEKRTALGKYGAST